MRKSWGNWGLGILRAQHLLPQVPWMCFLEPNGFQVHSGLSLPVFAAVRSGEENLIFSLTVLGLHMLEPSYTLPLPWILSLNEQFRNVKSL